MITMKNNRLILVFSIICLVAISVFCYGKITIRAADSMTIAPMDVINADGKNQIDIPVYINNNPGIMGFGLVISYDANYIEPIGVRTGSIIPGGSFVDSIGSNTKKGQFNIFWSGVENMLEDGELFVLSFKIKEDCSVDNTIIKISNLDSETFNENWEDVIPEFKDIKLVMDITTSPGPISTNIPHVTNVPDETNEPIVTIMPTATVMPILAVVPSSVPDITGTSTTTVDTGSVDERIPDSVGTLTRLKSPKVKISRLYCKGRGKAVIYLKLISANDNLAVLSYEYQYSLKKSFKGSCNVIKNLKKITLKKLISGKIYYFRARSIDTKNKKSKWSSVKKLRIK